MVTVSGFAERLPDLLLAVMARTQALIELVETASVEGSSVEGASVGGDGVVGRDPKLLELERRFEDSRQRMVQDLSNVALEAPVEQADYWVRQLVEASVRDMT